MRFGQISTENQNFTDCC